MQMTYAPTLFAEAAQSRWLPPISVARRNSLRRLYQYFGHSHGAVHLLRLLRGLRLRQLLQGEPADLGAARPHAKANFEARSECEVLKVNLDRSGKRATGVTYVDSSGRQWEQPAELVLICAFAFNNVHMMLLSGIGRPYDPQDAPREPWAATTPTRPILRIQVFFDDKIFNPFISSGACGQAVDDFNGDNFDHGGLDFIGGAAITCQPTDGRPLAHLPVPPGTPRWGARWKEGAKKNYLRSFGFTSQGSSYAAYANHLDLDPTYTDRFGRPLLRMTFDFPDNDIRMSNYLVDKMELIAKAMNPRQYVL